MDFLHARFDTSSETITLGGEDYQIPRQGLGGHYALESLAGQIKDHMEKGLYETVDRVMEWLHFATGFSEIWLEEQNPIELAEVFSILIELNAPKDGLPWMTHIPAGVKESTADYQNRRLAAIVHLLASQYHWSEDNILELPPEAVWCYIQEILISNHEQREWEYNLSERGFDKQGNKKEYPQLVWERKLDPKDGAPVPDFIKPKGVVVDLTKEG